MRSCLAEEKKISSPRGDQTAVSQERVDHRQPPQCDALGFTGGVYRLIVMAEVQGAFAAYVRMLRCGEEVLP